MLFFKIAPNVHPKLQGSAEARGRPGLRTSRSRAGQPVRAPSTSNAAGRVPALGPGSPPRRGGGAAAAAARASRGSPLEGNVAAPAASVRACAPPVPGPGTLRRAARSDLASRLGARLRRPRPPARSGLLGSCSGRAGGGCVRPACLLRLAPQTHSGGHPASRDPPTSPSSRGATRSPGTPSPAPGAAGLPPSRSNGPPGSPRPSHPSLL